MTRAQASLVSTELWLAVGDYLASGKGGFKWAQEYGRARERLTPDQSRKLNLYLSDQAYCWIVDNCLDTQVSEAAEQTADTSAGAA